MDEDNLLIICRTCGRKVLMHNMRPDDDGEHMICNDCWKKKAGVKKAGSFTDSTLNKTTVKTSNDNLKSKNTKTEKIVKYICTNCKYKFSRKATQEVHRCPYCGKETIVLDSHMNADKLIEESMDKKFDW